MIRIAGSAGRDLDEGYDFYESQEIGLGDYFLSSVKADIESLRVTAGVHNIAYADYHRLLCKTIPFAIYYTKSGQDRRGGLSARSGLGPRTPTTGRADKRIDNELMTQKELIAIAREQVKAF
jgi:hypothetical protein